MSPSVGYQPLPSLHSSVGALVGRAGALLVANSMTVTRQLEEARDAMIGNAALVVDLEAIETLGIQAIQPQLAR